MVTARTGALMTNAGRPADGANVDPTCSCCGRGHDTARHIILDCRALDKPRAHLNRSLEEILNAEQTEEFLDMGKQDRYMTLLGRQMETELNLESQKSLDPAVKNFLKGADRIRKEEYDMQPLTGTVYNRPPEHTAQMLQEWKQMEEENERRAAQEHMDGEDDYTTDSDEEDKPEHEG